MYDWEKRIDEWDYDSVEVDIETVTVNGMKMYKIEDRLFLSKLEALNYNILNRENPKYYSGNKNITAKVIVYGYNPFRDIGKGRPIKGIKL